MAKMFKSHYTTPPSPRSHLNLLGVCSSEVTVVLLSFLRWILLSISLYCTFVFRFVFFCELLHSRVVITLFLYLSIYIYIYLPPSLFISLTMSLSLISISISIFIYISISIFASISIYISNFVSNLSLPLSLRVSSCVHFLLHCPVSHSTHPVRVVLSCLLLYSCYAYSCRF